MASQQDCHFFYSSSCNKGDKCGFRHEPAAIGQPVCGLWKKGNCHRKICWFRHPSSESLRGAGGQCFFESQPSGCLNYHCPFIHLKPRPFPTNVNLDMIIRSQGLARPSVSQPPPNVPFRSRFPTPPQVFGSGLPRPLLPCPRESLRTPSIRGQSQYRPSGELHPVLFSKNSDLTVQNMGASLFSQNDNILNMTSVSTAAQQTVFSSPSVIKSAAGRSHYHDSLAKAGEHINNGASILPGLKARLDSNLQALAAGFSLNGLNTGDGLLPTVPGLHFPLGGLLPSNVANSGARLEKQTAKPLVRSSSKRTVKKLSKLRHQSSVKTSKRREDKHKSQDLNDERKRRKEKKSSGETWRGISSKERKVKKHRKISKSYEAHPTARRESASMQCLEEKGTPSEEDMYEEINLGFKVKTLEEILRDKALKKFQERQQMKQMSESNNKYNMVQPGLEQTSSSESVRDCEAEFMKQKLKPLKPLTNPLGTKSTMGDKISVNVHTDQEVKAVVEKRPLPPLKRLKPLKSTTKRVNTEEKTLKRHLTPGYEASPQLVQNKLRKLDTDSALLDKSSPLNNVPFHQVSSGKDSSALTVKERVIEDKTERALAGRLSSSRQTKRSIVVFPSGRETVEKPVDTEERIDCKSRVSFQPLPEKKAVSKYVGKEHCSGNAEPHKKISGISEEITHDSKKTSATKISLTKVEPNVNFNRQKNLIRLNRRLTKDFGISISPEPSKATPVVNRSLGDKKLVMKADGTAQQSEEMIDSKSNEVLNNKPAKMIKLNRSRLSEAKLDRSNTEGKSRILLSAFGRKMKVNKKRPLKEKQGVETSLKAFGSATLQETTAENKNVKNGKDQEETESQSIFTDKSETVIATNAPRLPSKGSCVTDRVVFEDETSSDPAKKEEMAKTAVINSPFASRFLSPEKESTSSELNRTRSFVENRASTLGSKDASLSQISLSEVKDRKVCQALLHDLSTSKPIKQSVELTSSSNLARSVEKEEEELQSSTETQSKPEKKEEKKNSLDRLVKEMTDDFEDEGEDFLDEFLAGLSPVDSDDEEDVSNADDLLLEIEEIINS